MPRRVEQFAPQLLLDGILRRLRGIQTAYGYNTQPRVTTDRRQLLERGPRHSLLVSMGDLETPTSTGAPRFRARQTVDVVGLSIPGKEDPLRVRNELLQDVMTALTTDLQEFAQELGGVSLAIGVVQPGEEERVSDDGLIGFSVPITYEWSQQPPW